jgi:hypothetical protein
MQTARRAHASDNRSSNPALSADAAISEIDANFPILFDQFAAQSFVADRSGDRVGGQSVARADGQIEARIPAANVRFFRQIKLRSIFLGVSQHIKVVMPNAVCSAFCSAC